MCDVGTIEKATLQLRKVTFVRALLTASSDAFDCPSLSVQLHMQNLLKWRFLPESLATKRSRIVVAYPLMADF